MMFHLDNDMKKRNAFFLKELNDFINNNGFNGNENEPVENSPNLKNEHHNLPKKYYHTQIPRVLQPDNAILKTEARKLEMPSPTKTEIQRTSNAPFVTIASAAILSLFLFIIAFLFYRDKRFRHLKSQEKYSILPKKKKLNSIDPAFYRYVCPQETVDFVVPIASVQSPLDLNSFPAKSPVVSTSPGPSCHDLTCLESGSVFGGLNPELYKPLVNLPDEFDFPKGHLGRLWFSLDYNDALERLSVHLIKVKNLPNRYCGSLNLCDPFVRIYLIPDERRYLQSRKRKKTCDPFFDETFVFQLPSLSIPERAVKFTVYDNDKGKRHVIIGHVVVPLCELNTSSTTPVVQWKDLEKEAEIQIPCDLGEMMISLCYNLNLERIIVTVCEARNLRPPEGCHALDTFVKITFMKENKVAKIKKTTVVRNTTDPKYNESFHFKMPQSFSSMCGFVLQVTQSGVKRKDCSLGRVVIGSYMFSRGKSLKHWEEAMSAGHKQIRFWHKLT